MKWMFTGSRTIESDRPVMLILQATIEKAGRTPSLIIHGGAPGADLAIDRAAKRLGIETAVRRPDYAAFRGREKAAPKARNSDMVEECDYLLGAWENESTGTADALEKIIKAGKPFVVYEFARDSFVELSRTEIYEKLRKVAERRSERRKSARQSGKR